MRRMPWAVYLWPGLPQLAGRGSWAALVVAFGAAALLSVALLGDVRVDSTARAEFAYTVLALVGRGLEWFGGAFRLALITAGVCGREKEENKDLFREALDYYLQGNWSRRNGAGPPVAKGSPRRGSPPDAGDLDAAHGARRGGGPAVGGAGPHGGIAEVELEIRHELDLLRPHRGGRTRKTRRAT